MSIRLSQRLLALAELVPPGARVIDVGTDHGMLPVYLAQEGISPHVWASDVRPGPLSGAASLIYKAGVQDIVFPRLADGLCGFTRDDADAVVIAGMGGETIVSILSCAEWLRDGVLLILSPHTKQHVLRRWLYENGFAVQSESLVRDAGRIYPVLTAKAGAPELYTAAELYTGHMRQIRSDPLFGEYLDGLIRRVEAAAPYDESAASVLEALRTMKER